MHTESHPLAGQTVYLNSTTEDPARNMVVEGAEYKIEDWWDLLTGKSWMFSDNNFAAMHYGIRGGLTNLPPDDEVVYGHILNVDERGTGVSLGHLVHVSELGDPK